MMDGNKLEYYAALKDMLSVECMNECPTIYFAVFNCIYLHSKNLYLHSVDWALCNKYIYIYIYIHFLTSLVSFQSSRIEGDQPQSPGK